MVHVTMSYISTEISNSPDEETDFTEDIASPKLAARNPLLYCFHCNRLEKHYFQNFHTWYHSLLVGFTYGAILFFGPFRCRCCGACRLFSFEKWHPRALAANASWYLRRFGKAGARQLKVLLTKIRLPNRENQES
jgi:hypothetical protein